MADQTHGAVDSVLGILASVIKDEAKLLGGIRGDIQFIRDEMESMNGFLLHLNKSGDHHDDQQRAWMKQVRDIAYIAQDCIQFYINNLPHQEDNKCRWKWAQDVRRLCILMTSWWEHHKLAKRMQDLKARVRDVGERRQRYGVTVPAPKADGKGIAMPRRHGTRADDEQLNKSRDEFLGALADDMAAAAAGAPSSSFDNSVKLLPKEAAGVTSDTLVKLHTQLLAQGSAAASICMQMLLRALHASPLGRSGIINDELLKNLLTSSNLQQQVMVLCYSELPRDYKSCLQYLTAFFEEKSISRTSLVRRWTAEVLVEDKQAPEMMSYEEAAEVCFRELLFRGFIYPADRGAAGKVKSCKIKHEFIKDFIEGMSETENFGSQLPTHLDNQRRIRIMVAQQQQQQQEAAEQQQEEEPRCLKTLNLIYQLITRKKKKEELEKSVDVLLKELRTSLPDTYRLNVLDLGGCRGLQKRHLKVICKMVTIKYLSLRNTDASCWLPGQINELHLLETLDIRQTKIDASSTKNIYPLSLKHLLAGAMDHNSGDRSTAGRVLTTVRMPSNVGQMTNMEILSQVKISRGSELSEVVGNLKKLRKLGVVLLGHGEEQDIKDLRQAISKTQGRLRSLSIWIENGCAQDASLDDHDHDDKSKNKQGAATILFSPPKKLESLSINGMEKCGLPNWVKGLDKLSKITLYRTELTASNLDTLGDLPGLLCLRLRRGSMEGELAFTAERFKALKFLLLEGAAITNLAFGEKSGPQLEKIAWSMEDITVKPCATGMKHLDKLKQLTLLAHDDSAWSLVQAAIADHPKRQAICVTTVDIPITTVHDGSLE